MMLIQNVKPKIYSKFEPFIEEIVSTIMSVNMPRTNKVEYFGYFIRTLTFRYIQITTDNLSAFNSYLFPEDVRKKIVELSNKIATLAGSSDLVATTEELYYVITSVMQLLLEQPELNKHGLKMLFAGSIQKTLGELSGNLNYIASDSKERVMFSRRHIAVLGLLSSIIIISNSIGNYKSGSVILANIQNE